MSSVLSFYLLFYHSYKVFFNKPNHSATKLPGRAPSRFQLVQSGNQRSIASHRMSRWVCRQTHFVDGRVRELFMSSPRKQYRPHLGAWAGFQFLWPRNFLADSTAEAGAEVGQLLSGKGRRPLTTDPKTSRTFPLPPTPLFSYKRCGCAFRASSFPADHSQTFDTDIQIQIVPAAKPDLPTPLPIQS